MVAWGFDGTHGTDVRPVHVAAGKAWAKDGQNGSNDGTRVTASLVNRLVANIRALGVAAGVTLTEDNDNDIANCILALIASTPPAAHDHDGVYYTIGQIDTFLALKADLSLKGIANGLAELDGSGKIAASQIPDALLGAVSFQGMWNASTNTPTLADGTGTKGRYYLVDTNGSTSLDGITDWKVGDWAIFDGDDWRKVDNTEAVVSVAGLTGAISASSLKAALGLAIADISGLQAALDAKIPIADLINNLTTADATKPLTAAQGKVLKDALDALAAVTAYPPGHIYGLGLANNSTDATNDIDIAAGSCRSDDNTENMAYAGGTKRLDAAWAVGTNQGGRDTGSISDAIWYVWLIKRTDTGVVDVLFSLSSSLPTMPADYTKKRRIGAIIRSSSAIRAFQQRDDEFRFAAGVLDVNVTDQSTSQVNRTLSIPVVAVVAHIRITASNAGAWTLLIISPFENNAAPNIGGAPGASMMAASGSTTAEMSIPTDNGTVRSRSTAASTTLRIVTLGWTDKRGRLG